ncbi:MAG TPA: RNase adapter RapZ [Propionibacteriaceae bacterium]|nr:RNase adapter RapZ [Propionibacteriaceae bacterium]
MSEQETSTQRLVVITGMSGAGRRTAAHAMEDHGWYVVDNIPPVMLPLLVRQLASEKITKLAVVIDVRSRADMQHLPVVFSELAEKGVTAEICFIEAADEVIVRRQESSRRPVPLQEDGRLIEGIRRERRMMSTLRAAADMVIDTSSLNVHQLQQRVAHAYGGDDRDELRVIVVSFGFKNGVPIDSDMVFDVRFLPNPHWVPELRPQTGLSEAVSEYVLGQPAAGPFLTHLLELLDCVLPGYVAEGKRQVELAIGCTGGKHRSTAIAEELARRLRERDLPVQVMHRDLGRE